MSEADVVTFEDAMAAGTARWGDPHDHGYHAGVEYAIWSTAHKDCFAGLEASARGMDFFGIVHETRQVWLLDRDPPPYFSTAPLVTLEQGVTAVTRWMEQHGNPLPSASEVHFNRLRALPIDWCDHHVVPNEVSYAEGTKVLRALGALGVYPTEKGVVADVDGGLGIYLFGEGAHHLRYAWFSCGNDGEHGVLMNTGENFGHAAFEMSRERIQQAVDFVGGGSMPPSEG